MSSLVSGQRNGEMARVRSCRSISSEKIDNTVDGAFVNAGKPRLTCHATEPESP